MFTEILYASSMSRLSMLLNYHLWEGYKPMGDPFLNDDGIYCIMVYHPNYNALTELVKIQLKVHQQNAC